MIQQKLHSFINAADLAAQLQKDRSSVLLIDVRSPAEFADLYIDGAKNVPLDRLSDEASNLGKDSCVVLVCRSGKRARAAADKMMELGLEPKVLDEGMTGWLKAGFPTRRGSERLSVERQTQLTIGVGILVGLSLGLFVSRWFLVLPAIFGCGLTFAGLSGTCGLAMALSKAPWNSGQAPSNASCCNK